MRAERMTKIPAIIGNVQNADYVVKVDNNRFNEYGIQAGDMVFFKEIDMNSEPWDNGAIVCIEDGEKLPFNGMECYKVSFRKAYHLWSPDAASNDIVLTAPKAIDENAVSYVGDDDSNEIVAGIVVGIYRNF